MGNFLGIKWKKLGKFTKNVLKKGQGFIEVAGNIGGALVGVPMAGTAASAAINLIPDDDKKKMQKAIVRDRVIKTAEIEKTFAKHNIPVTSKAVKEATKYMETTTGVKHKDNSNSQTMSLLDTLKLKAKKYWYLVAAGVGGLIYFHLSINKKLR